MKATSSTAFLWARNKGGGGEKGVGSRGVTVRGRELAAVI